MSDRMTMNDQMDAVFTARYATQTLSDSDKNIMADLAHEACEAHCAECGVCIFEPSAAEGTVCVDCTPTVRTGDVVRRPHWHPDTVVSGQGGWYLLVIDATAECFAGRWYRRVDGRTVGAGQVSPTVWPQDGK